MNSWDPIWEEVHQEKEWGRYPPEELVRFVSNNWLNNTPKEERKAIRILDAGCGTGAASWFLAREGIDTYGVDGSETAINKARDRLGKLNLDASFTTGQLDSLTFEDNFFHALIDIAAIQHNRKPDAKKIVNEMHRVLRMGGGDVFHNDC